MDRDLTVAIENEAAGDATAAQVALLAAHRHEWRAVLHQLLDETDDALAGFDDLSGPERDQLVADFEVERDRLLAALDRVEGARRKKADDRALDGPGECRLQASWSDGRLVAWAAGPGAPPASADDLALKLKEADAPAGGWWPSQPVPLPASHERAPAVAIGVGEALGWLAAVGAGPRPEGVGASVVWLGRVALWAVGLVARGSMVPALD
ncbi:MAG: hypothetical protein ABR511_06090, partial [Acidimicrobiales bacterium]